MSSIVITYLTLIRVIKCATSPCGLLLAGATETLSPKSGQSIEVNCKEKYHFFLFFIRKCSTNFKTIQFCCLSSEAFNKSREVIHLASSLWGNLCTLYTERPTQTHAHRHGHTDSHVHTHLYMDTHTDMLINVKFVVFS